MLNSGLPPCHELISGLNAVVFLSVSGERKRCVCRHTPCSPLPGGNTLQTVCSLFVLPIPGAKGVNSCVCLPRACCPSNCPVVRRRVPPQGLSDSSKTLQAVQVLTPWAQTTPRLPRGIAWSPGLVLGCVQTWWLCHRDGAPAQGGDPGAGEGERLAGLEAAEGESNSCLCQHEDKCKEINSYLKSKWGHGIRLWHVSV